MDVTKGSRTDLTASRYVVDVGGAGGLVDIAAVLLGADGRVRTDDDLVFFNNPRQPGVALTGSGAVEIDLHAVPADVQRVLVTGSTEAQGARFGDVGEVVVGVRGPGQELVFSPGGLTSETVLQVVALYRRGSGWRLDAIGQGYSAGLAAFATEHGIEVDEPEDEPVEPVAAPAPARTEPVRMEKVSISLTKDSPDRTARIDLRKSGGEPGWVLTVGLEWDGRGAVYDRDGRVTRYGTGDLDVYFFCRNEETDEFVVISGEPGHQGRLDTWPHIHHSGDSRDPGRGGGPAVEQVEMTPTENGDLLVNVYQSVDNGGGAIDAFGRPRIAIRYGRAGRDGKPGPDADEVLVHVGNGKNSFWATVAHIDVQDGILTVDGETRYSRLFSERMPGLDTQGRWVAKPKGGPVGRSKKAFGQGLSAYEGRCQPG
ncbi:TerD family protein [Pseudonocardia oceani]|uniref:TerD family protein n=1 Tax=Pseudonocardia oceani TaxID=2792013 RepID=UPI001C4A2824|nr:TerD family protein [Pseudonocardia oceani]